MTIQEIDIIRILQTKKDMLSKLLASAARAHEFLLKDNMDRFDDMMRECQDTMIAVDELDKTVAALNISLTANEPSVIVLNVEIDQIVKQIADIVNEDKGISEERLNSFGKQIKALRQTKQGRDGYKNKVYDAVFIDAKK